MLKIPQIVHDRKLKLPTLIGMAKAVLRRKFREIDVYNKKKWKVKCLITFPIAVVKCPDKNNEE